jgi:hypothetical protein
LPTLRQNSLNDGINSSSICLPDDASHNATREIRIKQKGIDECELIPSSRQQGKTR